MTHATPVILAASVAVLLYGCQQQPDSSERLRRAEAAFAAGEFHAAAVDARQALLRDPDSVRGRLLLGRASVELSDGAAAEKELRRAIELGTAPADVAVDLARALSLQNDFDRLLDEFAAGSYSEAVDSAITPLRADAYLGLGNIESAMELYETVLARQPDSVHGRLGIARCQLALGNSTAARELLERLKQEGASEIPVWLASAQLYLELRELPGAESDFRQAAELAAARHDDIRSAEALQGLTDVLLRQGKVQEGRQALGRLASVSRSGTELDLLRARAASLSGDHGAARRQMQYVIRLYPWDGKPLLEMGGVQLRSGNFEQADMFLSAALAAMPDNFSAERWLEETRKRQLRSHNDSLVSYWGIDPALGAFDRIALAELNRATYDEMLDFLAATISEGEPQIDAQLVHIAALSAVGRDADASNQIAQLAGSTGADTDYVGEALAAIGAYGDASGRNVVAAVREIAGKYPERAGLFELLGATEFFDGRFSDARTSFESAARQAPDDTRAVRWLVALDETEGAHTAAKLRFEDIHASHPAATWANLTMARLDARDGRIESARRHLQSVRDSGPATRDLSEKLASLYLAARDYDAAIAVAREGLSRDPGSAALYHVIGMTLLEVGDASAAVENLDRSIDLDPMEPTYHLHRIALFRNARRHEDAARAIQQAVDSGGQSIRLSLVLGLLLARSGLIEDARNLAKHVQNRFGERPEAYALEGEIEFRDRKLARAERAYAAAMKMRDVRGFVVRSNLIQTMLGKPDADKLLLQYMNRHPDDDEMRLLLADWYRLVGRLPASIAEYRKLVDGETANPRALIELAWTYDLAGDGRQARETLLLALETAPQDVDTLNRAGRILVSRGETEDGVRLLRQALELSHGRPAFRYHLALGLVAAGDLGAGRDMLGGLLATEIEFVGRSHAQLTLANL